MSEDTSSQQGLWAKGTSPDGKGKFEYLAAPQPLGPELELTPADPRVHGTAKKPVKLSAKEIAATTNGKNKK